jgi:uncharacterized protein YecE (DUF72 family)
MLAFYAGEFDSVEINNSFYRLPADETLRKWMAVTPPSFVFAFKASRYLTHMKKLTDPAEPLGRMLRSAKLLQPKLGPVLFQLPPRWRLNLERFRSFLALLPADGRFAVEFRDRSWFVEPVYQVLREHGVAVCLYEFGDFRSPMEITGDFVYIRLHGPAGPYAGLYDEAALSFWADRLRAWDAEGRDGYCYFDNDQRGYAVRNASQLNKMLGL